MPNEDKDVYDLTCTGTYSPTTAKQISWFLAEYFAGVSLADMKKIAGTEETFGAEITKNIEHLIRIA